ncbi:hypothetical protein HOY80DRAFT_1057696 [Tuber brumale]|nr:hypothetical protein HOY80DRAFT_1057696 [Tuber brumale]
MIKVGMRKEIARAGTSGFALFIRPPAPTPRRERPSISGSSPPALPTTPSSVDILHPSSTQQTRRYTFLPIGIPSSPSSSITSTPRTALRSSSLLSPALSSRMTSSSPARIPKPRVTYKHKQARKLIKAVRRMHAQICVAKLSVLDESVRRSVAGLKREVVGFLNTAQNVHFYLKADDKGWVFEADFSRMAMITGKWFRHWRGVREEIERKSKRKGKRYRSESEGDYEGSDFRESF